MDVLMFFFFFFKYGKQICKTGLANQNFNGAPSLKD